jgi:hypothetical protein
VKHTNRINKEANAIVLVLNRLGGGGDTEAISKMPVRHERKFRISGGLILPKHSYKPGKASLI